MSLSIFQDVFYSESIWFASFLVGSYLRKHAAVLQIRTVGDASASSADDVCTRTRTS